MRSRRMGHLLAMTTLVGAITLQGGCSITVGPGGNDNVNASKVTVLFVNSTGSPVNVQFHHTTDTLPSPDDDIFDEDYLSNAVGVAGSGWLTALTSDSLVLDCTDDLIVATGGGQFQNNAGVELGQGEPIVLPASSFPICGRTVTFNYRFVNGEYEVALSLTN